MPIACEHLAEERAAEIVLDLDATDLVHGAQEGRFFHGFYGHYCYLPLYTFAGEHLLGARLRPANIDASAGAREEVERIVTQVRAAWPAVRITLRADSSFCRDALMTSCEAEGKVQHRTSRRERRRAAATRRRAGGRACVILAPDGRRSRGHDRAP